MDNKQAEFINSFSARVNDSVSEIQMVELSASEFAFRKMGLVAQGPGSLWGLIVVCSKSLYFYVPSHTTALMSMIAAAGSERSSPEQIFCFNNIDGLQLFLSKRKWWQIFSQSGIRFSFLIEGQPVEGIFKIAVSAGADDLLEKMRAAYRA